MNCAKHTPSDDGLIKIFGFSPASAPGKGSSWLDFYSNQTHWTPSRFAHSKYHGFASSDSDRLSELVEILDQSALMMATRGGWGSLRLLKELEFSMNWTGKLMGFSDITALLNTLPFHSQVSCFHGPMYEFPNKIHKGGFLARSFEDFFLLNRKTTTGSFRGKIRGASRLEGALIGGNLSVLLALAGTRFMPDLEGKLLFLEEIKEPTYRVDRMLTQLSYLPGFQLLNGIIIGGFTQCVPSPLDSGDFSMLELIDDFYLRTRIPILEGAPIGHLDDFLILPMMGKSDWIEDSGKIYYSLTIPRPVGQCHG